MSWQNCYVTDVRTVGTISKSALQAALRKPAQQRHRLQRWIIEVFGRIGYHKTLVAIANKHARIIWALLVKGEDFDVQRLAATTA